MFDRHVRAHRYRRPAVDQAATATATATATAVAVAVVWQRRAHR
ncbi:hypothetical protein [Frankia sp. AiPs1]|nr:hypothetical protein [Frankia sp. AiPs1]